MVFERGNVPSEMLCMSASKQSIRAILAYHDLNDNQNVAATSVGTSTARNIEAR